MSRADSNCNTSLVAQHNDSVLALVRRSGLLIVASSALLLAFEYLEIAKVIGDPVQGGLSFLVSLLVATLIVMDCHRIGAAARLHWATYVLVSSGAMFMLISWTEDLEWFDDLPVFGRNDATFRKLTKVSLLASWFTTPPFLAWNMLQVHRKITVKLEEQVSDRTRRLR